MRARITMPSHRYKSNRCTLPNTAPGHWTGDWLGVQMFFSSHKATTNRQLLREAGLSLATDEVVAMREPEREVAFLWVLAKKRLR
jgi:hypothetical protein